MENYKSIEKVGEGAYGCVFQAKEISSDRIVAIKETLLKVGENGIPQTTLREIAILKLLSQSRYIVSLLQVLHDNDTIYLVFEYLDTDLNKFMGTLPKAPNVSPTWVKSFLFQLCKGVAYCHSNGVLHRDLKPQNLLLHGDQTKDQTKLTLKIADFGLARANADPLRIYSNEVVTVYYRAPEILLGATNYSNGVDMWSVGCIFAEMVRMQVLFQGNSELDQLTQIFRLLGTPTEEQWPGISSLPNWLKLNYPPSEPMDLTSAVPSLEPDGVGLLKEMLKYNPHERISAKAALDHPYFDSLDKLQY